MSHPGSDGDKGDDEVDDGGGGTPLADHAHTPTSSQPTHHAWTQKTTYSERGRMKRKKSVRDRKENIK